jgi:site-specific recombinase XerD
MEQEQATGQYEIRNITVFKSPKLIIPVDEDGGCNTIKLHPNYHDVTSPTSSHLPKIDIQILIDQNGDLERAACLYLYSRVKNDNRKNMATEATALLMYFRYLAASDYQDKYGEIHPLRWDVHPFETNIKPVHMFKNWLYDAVENGTPAVSTARMYILSVVRFYKFVLRWRLCDCSEQNMPFKIEWTKIKVSKKNPDSDMLSHTYTKTDSKGHWVATTDVMNGFHRNTKQTKRQKLRPFRAEHQELFLDNLHLLSERDQLMHECSLKVGLRATECASLKDDLIVNPLSNEPVKVRIGPETRVETKYSVNRDVEFPSELMRRLYQYKMCNNRQKYVNKGTTDGVFDGDLFLTSKGTRMTGETLSKYFIRYATKLQAIDMTFAHKHHNLRSTFATNYLWGEVAKGRSLGLVAGDLQSLMGHENLTTTMEYVGFIETELSKKKHVNNLSYIAESAMTALD